VFSGLTGLFSIIGRTRAKLKFGASNSSRFVHKCLQRKGLRAQRTLRDWSAPEPGLSRNVDIHSQQVEQNVKQRERYSSRHPPQAVRV
jgi:hypothetical protein